MRNLFLLALIAVALLLSTAAIAQDQQTTTTQQTTTSTTTSTPSSDASSASSSSAASAPDGSDAAAPAASSSQDASNSAAATSDSHSNVRSLTGCLQKGESANEWDLTAQDGSTWELRSDAVDLASHAGHTVTVTGAVNHSGWHNMKEDTRKEAQEHGMDKSASEHGHLTVTDLQMVSTSCNASH